MATKTYRRYDIGTADLFSSDLRQALDAAESSRSPWTCGRIRIDGQANTAEYVAVEDRIGIAWGADADWDDLPLAVDGDIDDAIDAAIARWLAD